MIMATNNFKMAMGSLKSSKWRSFLTMLGVIIGVASVTTMISLGEGVRGQISSQIDHLGKDLITVKAGKLVERSANGQISSVNLPSAFSSSYLSEADNSVIAQSKGVKWSVPFSLVNGQPSFHNQNYQPGFIIGTNNNLPGILNQKVEFGNFFSPEDPNQFVAVIGRKVANQLFKENVPLGKSLQIRGQNFVVRGIFEEFSTTPLTPNSDFNQAVFIPFQTAKALSGQSQIYQILVKPLSARLADATAENITQNLYKAHGQQTDFTVLKSDENLEVANTVFNLLTALIASIAAISLVVGGIGIMNVMFVSVTERTREIGIRKAIGATNPQVLSQFMTEAAVISFIGGILGIVLSIAANYLIRIFTNLQPVINYKIMIASLVVATLVGIFFGITPAIKAARKDPIDALRYE